MIRQQPGAARRLVLPPDAHPPLIRPEDMRAPDRGWMPIAVVSVLQGLGLLFVALAYAGAIAEAAWAPALRWLALITLFLPVAVRQVSASTSRQERVILLALLGLSLFAVKVLYSPFQYKFSDELQHWRTAQNIVESGRLFGPNNILLVSPFYPGLEIITAGVVQLTGLSIYAAGVAVMAVARLALVLALFLLFDRAAASARIAGVATLIYMTHPHFMFLNAMFTYQALALTFAALLLLAGVRIATGQSRVHIAWRAVFGLVLVALVATHHITTYLTIGLLALYVLAGVLLRHPQGQVRTELIFLGLAATVTLSWLSLIAPETIHYILNGLQAPLSGLSGLLAAGEARAGQMFRPPSGPLIDKLVSVAAIGAMLVGLGLGWLQIWRRRATVNALCLALAVAAAGYVASLGIRFLTGAGELTGRLWTFVFAPAALVWSVGMIQGRPSWLYKEARVDRMWFKWGVPALAVVIFLGGVTSGWPPYWGRLPGSYLPGAAERSVNPEGVAAAQWVGATFPPGKRFATDFTNYMLLGSYGHQYPVFGLAAVFASSMFGTDELEHLRQAQVRYLLVDRRLASGPPPQGYYFDPWESQAMQGQGGLNGMKLSKFDYIPGINRVYDSGNIVIYDVGELSGVR